MRSKYNTHSNEDLEKFVRLHLTAVKEGRNVQWVADRMGFSRATATKWAQMLRKRGVKLPRINPKRVKVDVESLNNLVRERK